MKLSAERRTEIARKAAQVRWRRMVSPSDANDFIELQLDERIRVLEEKLDADAVTYSGN